MSKRKRGVIRGTGEGKRKKGKVGGRGSHILHRGICDYNNNSSRVEFLVLR